MLFSNIFALIIFNPQSPIFSIKGKLKIKYLILIKNKMISLNLRRNIYNSIII